MEVQSYFKQFSDLLWLYGVKVLLALVVLFVGIWLIRHVTGMFRNFLSRRRIDPNLRPFLVSLVDVGMKVLLLLVIANNTGLKTTSFLALFSALALSIGLALQGSLGNFASGMLILMFKPFRVGDWLEVEGKKGYVAEIQIFSTLITAPDKRIVIIPNGKITQGIIEKIGSQGQVRVTINIGLENSDDLERLEALAHDIIRQHPGTAEAEVAVEVLSFSGAGAKVSLGYWTTGAKFGAAASILRRELKQASVQAGIAMSID